MSSHKNIVLQFSSSNCQPCRQATQYVKALGQQDKVFHIDVMDNDVLSSDYKIKGVPTFVLLDIDGKEVERFVGFDKVKIDNMLEKV